LGCGAFLHHVQRKIPHISTPCSPFCCAPACTGRSRFETLSHAFLDCPDTAPAMDWLCGAWAALTGKARPPLSAAVLLADDLTAWIVDSQANQPLLLPLWSRLRVAVLGGIWKARCAREKGSASAREQGTLRYISVARMAITEAVTLLVEAIERDWLRTSTDIRTLDNGFFCAEWWRGLNPALSLDTFMSTWTHVKSFARIRGGRWISAGHVGLTGCHIGLPTLTPPRYPAVVQGPPC
jgi:hypothetical protein